VLREGDLALDTASGDAAALAARITRHLARNPAILEDSDNLLETARDID
jgi:hypothetical protein